MTLLTFLLGVAAWCSQCKAIAPEVEKMASEFDGKIKFYTFDVDTNPDVAQELGVNSMPTFTIFKDGEVQESVSGARPKQLRTAIENNLK